MFKWKKFNEKLAVKLKSMFKPLIACLFKVVDQRSQLLTVPVIGFSAMKCLRFLRFYAFCFILNMKDCVWKIIVNI